VTLACFAGAYFLIKYRRAERVGMPYVYKGMGLVIPGIVIFAITVPVSYFISINVRGQEDTMDYYSFTQNNIPGMIIGTIISTFILYIIMELIDAVCPIVIPLAFSAYFDIFDGFIQAYVFVFLTSLFINEAIEDDD